MARMPRQHGAPSPFLVRISGTLTADNETLVVPFGDNETPDHWLLKLMAARMLALDGYPASRLTAERPITVGGTDLRADLLGEGTTPQVWIECLNCQCGKLKKIAQHFRGRIIHVDTFWWGQPQEIADLADYAIRWFHPSHLSQEGPSLKEDDEPFSRGVFDPVGGIEHWHCDLRSPPAWGVRASDEGELFFLEEDELGVRPLPIWKFLWVKHARESGRKPYEVEELSPEGLFVPSQRFLLKYWGHGWDGLLSPAAIQVIQQHGRDPRQEADLGYVIELLLSWGFPSQAISIRRRTHLGSRQFVPYVLAETQDRRIWIERTLDTEKLNYVGRRFRGKVLVLDEMDRTGLRLWLNGAAEEDLELPLPVGTEHWHTYGGILTGWGVSRITEKNIRIFRAQETKSVPWTAADLFFSRYGLSNFRPRVMSFGAGQLSGTVT